MLFEVRNQVKKSLKSEQRHHRRVARARGFHRIILWGIKTKTKHKVVQLHDLTSSGNTR